MESLEELIFTLFIIGASILAVLVQKAATKRTREKMRRGEELRRQAPDMRPQIPHQYGHPQRQAPPPRASTQEEQRRQPTGRYQEAAAPGISRPYPYGPAPGGSRLPARNGPRVPGEDARARHAAERYNEAAMPEASLETPPLRGIRPVGEPLREEEWLTTLGAEKPQEEIAAVKRAPGLARLLKRNITHAIIMGEIFGPPLAERPPRW